MTIQGIIILLSCIICLASAPIRFYRVYKKVDVVIHLGGGLLDLAIGAGLIYVLFS